MDCDHTTLLALISADSPKLKLTTLSRGARYRKIFRQITYLDQVIEDYLWCTLCKKLLVYRSSNLVRHWRTHQLSKSKVKHCASGKTEPGHKSGHGHKTRHGQKAHGHGYKSRHEPKQRHHHRHGRVHCINF